MYAFPLYKKNLVSTLSVNYSGVYTSHYAVDKNVLSISFGVRFFSDAVYLANELSNRVTKAQRTEKRTNFGSLRTCIEIKRGNGDGLLRSLPCIHGYIKRKFVYRYHRPALMSNILN